MYTRKKGNTWQKIIIIIATILITLIALAGCGSSSSQANQSNSNISNSVSTVTNKLNVFSQSSNLIANQITVNEDSVKKIHKNVPLEIFTIDVGQGDAHLIRVKDDYYLVDTGDVDHRDFIVARLKNYGISEFKGIILTHADSDHLGGFWAIAQNFKIDQVYDNGLEKSTSVYRTYLKTLKNKNIPRKALTKGDEVNLGNDVNFLVYAPWSDPIKDKKGNVDQNNNCVIGKLVYGKFSMLFTGDAEKLEEDRVIKEQNSKLFSHILKVGHHGSNGSSQEKFIRSIKPDFAVISVGLNNEYGHPGSQTLNRLIKEKVQVLRSDLQGTINIETDGKIWSFITER